MLDTRTLRALPQRVPQVYRVAAEVPHVILLAWRPICRDNRVPPEYTADGGSYVVPKLPAVVLHFRNSPD